MATTRQDEGEGGHVSQTTEQQVSDESLASFSLLLLLFVLFLCLLTAYFLRHKRSIYLQESGATIIFGCVVGLIIRFALDVDKLKSIVTFDPEFFFLFLLPPIIFESGYNMKRRAFFTNLGAIILYAFAGTIIATFVTGLLLYAASYLGLMTTDLHLLECLIFGSLISATDPVSVLSVLRELGVDINLYSNVFGESVLNDAVAIVLYRSIAGFLSRPVSTLSFFYAVGEFILVFLGSVVVGVVIGLLSALLFKHTELWRYPILESSILTLYAYASYLLADGLTFSGIVSILFCGITMAHYTFNNLSQASKDLTSNTFQLIGMLCENLVFVYLGLALFTFNEDFDWGLIICATIIVILARVANIFPLSWIVNRTRPPAKRISLHYQLFMWFAGLRGAMAFTLSLNLPSPITEEVEKAVFTTTLMIVFVTVLVQGAFTIPVLRRLQVPMEGFEAVHQEDPYEAPTEPSYFLNIDNRYIKPFFSRFHHPPDPHTADLQDHEHYELKDIEESKESLDEPEAQPKIVTSPMLPSPKISLKATSSMIPVVKKPSSEELPTITSGTLDVQPNVEETNPLHVVKLEVEESSMDTQEKVESFELK